MQKWIPILAARGLGGLAGLVAFFLGQFLIKGEEKFQKNLRQGIVIGCAAVAFTLSSTLLAPTFEKLGFRLDFELNLKASNLSNLFLIMKEEAPQEYETNLEEIFRISQSRTSDSDKNQAYQKVGNQFVIKHMSAASNATVLGYMKEANKLRKKTFAADPALICRTEMPTVFGALKDSDLTSDYLLGMINLLRPVVKNSIQNGTPRQTIATQEDLVAFLQEFAEENPGQLEFISDPGFVDKHVDVKDYAGALVLMYEKLEASGAEKCAALFRYLRANS